MKKVEFTQKPYLLLLIVVIIYYVSINVILLLQGRSVLALLPLAIQAILIILVFLRHWWLVYAVKTFSLLCIVPAALRLFSQVMFMLARATDKIDYDVVIKCLLILLVSIVLFAFCDKSIRIVEGQEARD